VANLFCLHRDPMKPDHRTRHASPEPGLSFSLPPRPTLARDHTFSNYENQHT
jgi:hypothetical protein